MTSKDQPLTVLLGEVNAGDRAAAERLYDAVQTELHRLAQQRLAGERPDALLQTTMLVNEAYLKLARGRPIEWQDRKHFFAVAARVLRQVLLDHVRARGRDAKRLRQLAWDVAGQDRDDLGAGEAIDVEALDRLLEELARREPRQASVVELKFFGGRSVEEIAECLGVATRTVEKDWKLAREWIEGRLRDEAAGR